MATPLLSWKLFYLLGMPASFLLDVFYYQPKFKAQLPSALRILIVSPLEPFLTVPTLRSLSLLSPPAPDFRV